VNAPLRRVAISVLVLFTLLIVNVNVIQVVRSEELRSDGRNTRVLAEEYDRERGLDRGQRHRDRLLGPDRRPAELPRQYSTARVAPVTGYYSLVYGNAQMERAANEVLSGTDDRLFVRRLADLFTGRDPAGGDVVLTMDPASRRRRWPASRDVTGAVVALDPSTGAVPGHGQHADVRPEPALQPRARGRSARTPTSSTPRDRPPLNRAIDARYSPGSIFKVVVSAAALASGEYTPDTVVPAPRSWSCRAPRRRWRTSAARPATPAASRACSTP
jgi:peptidoglycan glycosyltransferase